GMVANEDVAQDLVQEAMLQAYLCLDRLQDDKRFQNWLYGIVLNVCRSHIRDRSCGLFLLRSHSRRLTLRCHSLHRSGSRSSENC
ncbi:MAG: hypothetical protein ICV55_12760, partial [Coleofasciculus sp. C3-bin4]|nr:hypothetical protein [Coleofasciculus sp. C3-bin4]